MDKEALKKAFKEAGSHIVVPNTKEERDADMAKMNRLFFSGRTIGMQFEPKYLVFGKLFRVARLGKVTVENPAWKSFLMPFIEGQIGKGLLKGCLDPNALLERMKSIVRSTTFKMHEQVKRQTGPATLRVDGWTPRNQGREEQYIGVLLTRGNLTCVVSHKPELAAKAHEVESQSENNSDVTDDGVVFTPDMLEAHMARFFIAFVINPKVVASPELKEVLYKCIDGAFSKEAFVAFDKNMVACALQHAKKLES